MPSLPAQLVSDSSRIMPGMISLSQTTSSQAVPGILNKSESFAREKSNVENKITRIIRKQTVSFSSDSLKFLKQVGIVYRPRSPLFTQRLRAARDDYAVPNNVKSPWRPVRTLILDNYDSYTYNLYQLLSIINGVEPVVLKNDEITWQELIYLLYEEKAFDNVVISPGPGSPTCASDIGVCLQLLKECHDIPILGVCLGHQALAAVHGAKVIRAPEAVHGRLSELQHNGYPLFTGIPSGVNSGFKVVRYHSLIVDSSALPEQLVATAWTTSSNECISVSESLGSSGGRTLIDNREAWHHGSARNNLPNSNVNDAPADIHSVLQSSDDNLKTRVIMGLSHRQWPHHGVQFHPESVATAYGKRILENFRSITVEFWKKHPRRPNLKIESVPILSLQRSVDFTDAPEHNQELLLKAATLSLDESLECPSTPSLDGHSFDRRLDTVEAAVAESKSEVIGQAEKVRLCWKRLPSVASKVGGSRVFSRSYMLEKLLKIRSGWIVQHVIRCLLFEWRSFNISTFSDFERWIEAGFLPPLVGRARFSFMGGKGGLMWQRFTYHIGYSINDDKLVGVLKTENASGQVKETVLQEGFLNLLNKELELRVCVSEDYASLPFDFCGGFVGYLGYELKVECGSKTNRHKSGVPDAAMFLADQLVAVDHANDDVYVLALYREGDSGHVSGASSVSKTSVFDGNVVTVRGSIGEQRTNSRAKSVLHADDLLLHRSSRKSSSREMIGANRKDAGRIIAVEWVEMIAEKIATVSQQGVLECEFFPRWNIVAAHGGNIKDSNHLFIADKSKSAYLKDVKSCQDLIAAGETYEVCLTTQLRRKFTWEDRFGLYLMLRETNPAPYAAWMQFGKDGPCICSSSPERFLRLDRKGVLEAKPIKGTVARGNNPHEDDSLKKQLQNSEKDQAENLMIVDLLRNDLGRVCKPGSVHVPDLMVVESYSTVHTMVSTVTGNKRDDVTPVDCVKAAFPGGSMTGAPKLRTMDIIDSLENSARGIYSGTIGYFSFSSSFDLNIVIRTLVIHDGEATLGAGGAVVALSSPASEYEEMLLKTKAPSQAISQFESARMVSGQIGSTVPLGS